MDKVIKKVLKEYLDTKEVYSDDAMTVELLRKAKEDIMRAHRYIESAAQYALNLDEGSEIVDEIMGIKKDLVYGSIPYMDPNEDSCNILWRLTKIIHEYDPNI